METELIDGRDTLELLRPSISRCLSSLIILGKNPRSAYLPAALFCETQQLNMLCSVLGMAIDKFGPKAESCS
jgi:hypothetical protein